MLEQMVAVSVNINQQKIAIKGAI